MTLKEKIQFLIKVDRGARVLQRFKWDTFFADEIKNPKEHDFDFDHAVYTIIKEPK